LIYLNPLQRDADDAMWADIQQRKTPLWALRTLAGAAGEPERIAKLRQEKPDDPGLRRAEHMAAIARECGCDWTSFCMRFAASLPNLVTTIGGTGDLTHLEEFLSAAKEAKPLPAEVMTSIEEVRGS
jgi:aryl-alcohol dehydrogenase-like predicted oxidoreductase